MNSLLKNPILMKELRGRMRGNRAFVVLTIYLVLLSILVGGIFLIYEGSRAPVGTISERQVFGKVIFGLVIWMELMTVSFVAPALTAASISGERENQTFDLLRTTLLPARSVVLGKFLSGLVFLLLLLFAALPLASLAFLFGGVAPEEVLVSGLMLVVTTVTFCAAGVFFSSWIHRSLFSTVLAYAFAILSIFGLPMFFTVGITVINLVTLGMGNANSLSPIMEGFLFISGWLVISLNPLGAAIASEIVLLEEQSLFLFQLPLSSGGTITLISPWIPYIAASLLLSLILLRAATRFVRRVER